jgi:hypothetical protein
MQRKLFLVLSLVVLMSLAGSAVAAEPQGQEPTTVNATIYTWGGEWQLGERVQDIFIAFDPLTMTILPYETVGGWLYRPDTDPIFAPRFPAEWDLVNEFVKPEGQSALRRQFKTVSDSFGFYYFRFMLPRDENWYPCSWPCKWKCNYYNTANGWTFHSPQLLWFRYPDYRFTDPPKPYWPEPTWVMTHEPLYWPWDLGWVDPFVGWIGNYGGYGPPPLYLYYDYPILQDASPFDTVHPLEIWFVNTDGWAMDIVELKIQGFIWQPTDTTVDDYLAEWPYICGDPYEWPDYDQIDLYP